MYMDWQQQTMPTTAVLTTTRTEYRQQGRALSSQSMRAGTGVMVGDAVE